jgi:hypothetical protein
MKRMIWTLVVVLTLVLTGTLFAWGKARRALVHSEPLPCLMIGERVYCFDGQPGGQLMCEQLRDSVVLCKELPSD